MYRIFAALWQKEDVETLKENLPLDRYQLVFAGNYSHATSLWHAHENFDLALVDVNTPIINGWTLLENIRQNAPNQRFPILVLLNQHEPEALSKAFDLGTTDVLLTPLHFRELLARVQAYLPPSIPNEKQIPIVEKTDHAKAILGRNKLLSIITHDLRNPLGAIKIISGMIQNAVEQNDRKELKELFAVLGNTIEGNFKLLENMAKWARLQAGKTDVQPSELILAPLVDEVLEGFSEKLNGKKIRVDNRVDDEIMVFADPDLLKFVLQNLISNAIKYSYPQKGSVVIESKTGLAGTVKIMVRDNGIGISPVILEKLFKIDGNISSLPGTAGEEGTGLGLIICAEFAQVMNGELEVYCEKKGGSEFILTLPVAEQA